MSSPPTSCGKPADREALPPGLYDSDPVTRGEVAKSKMSRRRAWTLVLIHLVAFAHILVWKLGGEGETLSPVEPSEGLYTVANGVLNAGAILLVLSMISTIVLGRFFCGWACHLVALQDLCAWLLAKMGIRPRPLRSKRLVLIPLFAGIYLFFWPEIRRWFRDDLERPELEVEMTKSDFWETFPDFWIGLLTFLVCGFGMVYLLGAKGFCTYACPYGGLFGVADRFAPLRIRVNDACKACGHCTAVCTSNVAVAHEVHRYGAVVDPGCMKCMDCVSVCPENALSLGMGKPAILQKPRREKKDGRSFLSFGEDLLVFFVFAFTLLVLMGLPRGLEIDGEDLEWATELHSVMPLLFGLGLSASSGFLALFLWRLLRRSELGFHRIVLKSEGRLRRAGVMMAVFAGLWFVLVGFFAAFQWSMWGGDRLLQGMDFYAIAESRRLDRPLEEGMEERIAEARARFERAEALRLFPDIRPQSRLAGLAFSDTDWDQAIHHFERAIEIDPNYADSWLDLSRVQAAKGDGAKAKEALEEALRLAPERLDVLAALVETEKRLGQLDSAAIHVRRILEIRREAGETTTLAPAWQELGMIEANRGRGAEARLAFEKALELDSSFVAASAPLGHLARDAGKFGEAARYFAPYVERFPFDFQVRYAYRDALRRDGRAVEADADVARGFEQLGAALEQDADNVDLLFYLAAEEIQAKRFDDARGRIARILELRPGWPAALQLQQRLPAPSENR